MNEQIERVEWVFNGKRLMACIRQKTGKKSLRDLAVFIPGMSASVLSRWDNGYLPEVKTLCEVCSALDLEPGQFFEREVWVRKGDGK